MNLSVGSEDRVRIRKLRERSTRVYTVDDEDIRSSRLVNGGLMMYTPRCRCGVQVDR
jgi:hypothetical protein